VAAGNGRPAQADLTQNPSGRAGCAAATRLTEVPDVTDAAAGRGASATTAAGTGALADVRSSASDGALRLVDVAASGFASERWHDLQDTSSVTAELTRV